MFFIVIHTERGEDWIGAPKIGAGDNIKVGREVISILCFVGFALYIRIEAMYMYTA